MRFAVTTTDCYNFSVFTLFDAMRYQMSENRNRPRGYDLFYQEIPATDYFGDFETEIQDYVDTEQQPSLSESQVSQLAEDSLGNPRTDQMPEDYDDDRGLAA